jgi:spore germination protein YaaH
VCTLEPRTPPDSLWKNPPSPLPYSNDYAEIKEHCDVIQIMTYDQQRADIKLNESKAGQPYFPNSDPDWVEKVVEHTVKELPNEKLMLGIPTYGRHMAVTVAPNWFSNYQGLGAVNPPQAHALAKQHKIKPSVNRAGEQSFTYFPKEMKRTLRKKIEKMKVGSDVTSGMKAAMQALAYADKTGETVTVNMVWWSDARAIEDKVKLAKKYNLRGVAVFKIDGQEDAVMWNVLK